MYLVLFLVSAAMSEAIQWLLSGVPGWLRVLLYSILAVIILLAGDKLVDRMPAWMMHTNARASIVVTLASDLFMSAEPSAVLPTPAPPVPTPTPMSTSIPVPASTSSVAARTAVAPRTRSKVQDRDQYLYHQLLSHDDTVFMRVV
jgi:hypothetical protein